MSVAGNVVGTVASMIQLHMNLMQWGSIDEVLSISSPELWQRVEPHNGIPGKIAGRMAEDRIRELYAPLYHRSRDA